MMEAEMKVLMASLVTLFASLFVAQAAYATTWASASGTMCQVTDGEIEYSATGARNPAASVSEFICPLPLGTQSSYPQAHSNVVLIYTDSNNDDAFYCSVCQYQAGGSYNCSQGKYTCSNYGGCYDWTVSYVGAGTIIWDTTDLGSNVYNQYVDANLTVICDVPAYDTNGPSVVRTYFATL
jgi:hypothetical protein